MKSLIRKLSLGLIIVAIPLLSFGCNNDKQPQSKMEILTNVGFLSNLTTEDGKDYVEIVIMGEDLKLEVKDKDLLDGLKEMEFYKFAYDKNNILLSIEDDSYLEDLVKKSMAEGIDPNENNMTEKRISPENKVSTEGFILLDSYEFDINGDGVEETISMYTNAEKGSDGEIYWDDGQDWLFLVEGKEHDYILFKDYVQLGNIKFHIYTVDDDFYITTIQSGTANLDIVEYKFDQESKEFISILKHNATGNVNMMHSSSGY